jgi:inosine/xanthosine triphosphate pyrophosphatase family protein
VFECAEGDDRTIGVTYAEMDKVDKNRVSHRARAFGKLKVFLAGERN